MALASIGEVIRSRRESIGLTQFQLAEKLGIHDRTIGFYEQGIRVPGDEMLGKICRVLHMPERYKELMAIKHPGHAAVFRKEKTPHESEAKKALDEAQGHGIIPAPLPEMVVNLIITEVCRRKKKSLSMHDVKVAYQAVKDSDPRLNEQCEIWELMLNPTISPHDLAEIKALLELKGSRGEKAKGRK